jgi:hypothetical protein
MFGVILSFASPTSIHNIPCNCFRWRSSGFAAASGISDLECGVAGVLDSTGGTCYQVPGDKP